MAVSATFDAVLQLSARCVEPRSVELAWNLYEEQALALQVGGTLHGYRIKVGSIEISVDLRKLAQQRRRLYFFKAKLIMSPPTYRLRTDTLTSFVFLRPRCRA